MKEAKWNACVIRGNTLHVIMSSLLRAFCTVCYVHTCQPVHSEVCLEAYRTEHGSGLSEGPVWRLHHGPHRPGSQSERLSCSLGFTALLSTQCFCVTRSASTLPQINESLESILQKLFWDSSVSSGMCFLLPIRPS